MADVRLRQYAELLVNRGVGVKPGWQVLIQSSPLARPLVEEVIRAVAKAGGHPTTMLSYDNFSRLWLENVPEEQLDHVGSIQQFIAEKADCLIAIQAPENRQAMSGVDPLRMSRRSKATRPLAKRQMTLEMPWSLCQYPTSALAQDAGMSTAEFEEFLYGACLLDWDEEARKMQKIKDRFDAADEVRIVAEGTDLVLRIKDRAGIIDDGRVNIPGGEVFYAPLEDATEGHIHYTFPSVYGGQTVSGIRLQFKAGQVVEATATENESFLHKMLETDAGARILGEFGIGCNPGVTRCMKNTLYDEKMNGTIHLAIGAAYEISGGTNKSAVHWDMVCDLRQGRMYCDGVLVQENGTWNL